MRTTVEMAREAGIRDCTCNGTLGCLERFAELVRADERARMAEQPAQQEYERGFIDGMQEQMKRSVDKAVNAMTQRTWVGLTHEEVEEVWEQVESSDFLDCVHPLARAIEAKLKEKNT